jgi:holliday junction DNA helicase RuvA
MIASLRGEIISIGSDSLVVDVNGVGLRVYVPAPVKAQASLGSQIFLQTHMVVREDAITLYGFEHEEERNFFLLLLGVNGVGPRLGISILSTLTVDAIRRAILSEQSEIFARVPGVGKKTAQKIQLYLQGKVGEASPMEGYPTTDVDTEVLQALTALGYSVVEAQAALQSIPRGTPFEVEARLRQALLYFSS